MKLSERLDILATIMKDVGQGQTAMAATVQEAAKLVRRVENEAATVHVEAGGCAPPVIAGPLNEPFGNPEELPLNELPGDSGQLASLEQRGIVSWLQWLVETVVADGAYADIGQKDVDRVRAFRREFEAALSAQPRGVEPADEMPLANPPIRESGWLIEHGAHSPPAWYRGQVEGSEWTLDSAEAIRFSRREDAQRVLDSLVPRTHFSSHFASEHVWIGAASQSREVAP